MRIAAAAWPLERPASWTDYRRKLAEWVGAAEADLIVMPEYAGMEAALIHGPGEDTPPAWVDHGAALAGDVAELYREVGAGRWLLTGSVPVATEGGIVNRAWLISPGGRMWPQDKQIPTPWERAETPLVGGDPLSVVRADLGADLEAVGTLICHDAEFPDLAGALVALGAEILLIPACTDGVQGAARLRVAARARALEGTCLTVLSQTVGEVPGCCFLDVNRGLAGIYGPPDLGMPEGGILAEGGADRAGWVRADVPSAALADLRAGLGEVRIALDAPMARDRAALARG